MCLLGLVMGGRIYPAQADNPLTVLAFLSDLGNGLLYILSRFLPLGLGEMERVSFEFGSAYLAGAGLLNFLIALDAWDIGREKNHDPSESPLHHDHLCPAGLGCPGPD